ncbi:MAG: ATP synthase subunit I [Sarcina sp.]
MKRNVDKEKREIKKMISAISKIDILLSCILTVIIILFNFYYGIAFFVGNIIAVINFAINGIVIHRSFNRKKGSAISIQLSYILRMGVIIAVAFTFHNNFKALLFYMVGFIFHQVAMFIYSKLKEKAIIG